MRPMITFFLILILSTASPASVIASNASITVEAASYKPITAIYVFGDSTVDPGNNDYLPTSLFRADHAPYGVDFPGRVPTGRFSDGRLATDYAASHLRLKDFIPAYSDSSVNNQDLLTGVSFASAGSGLDELTIGISHAINLRTQVANFEQALRRMQAAVGADKTRSTVENAMFLISIGSNDMLFNYFDLPTRTLLFTPSTYSDFLLSRLEPMLERLYNLGARRFAVAGLPPLGCLPVQVSVNSFLPSNHWLQRVCVGQQNSIAQVYNGRLLNVLHRLQTRKPSAKFVYADIYTPLMDMINHPQRYGFRVTLEGCCGTGILEAGTLCNRAAPICSNPSSHVFWDSIHPSQAANYVLANALQTNVIPKL